MNDLALNRIHSLMQLRQEVEALHEVSPWVPPVDWIETDTELLLIADVPGIEADAFELLEEGGAVTVKGQRPTQDGDGASFTLAAERPQGSFQRTLRLPLETLPGSGRAQLRAGVLTVRFEKRHKTIDPG